MKSARKKGSIGVIGLGIMGGAFARHLTAAGWHVVGFDVDRSLKRAMTKAGVEFVDGVKELAEKVPVMISSLPHPSALDETVAALVEEKLTPKVLIETSTFALDDKMRAQAELNKAGHLILDCPVSGTGAQAAVKDVVIYASGNAKTIAKWKPMLSDFSRGVHDVGEYGNGSKMKYVANLLVAIHNVASAEAMVLGIKSGLDPHQMVELVSAGAGTSRMFELRAPMMADDDYQKATMKVQIFQKDMGVISGFAAKLGVPVPTFAATMPIYAAAQSMGYGMQDTAAVCAVIERMAAVKRKKGRRKR